MVWHSFGLTHFPRPEDWPIMPVDRVGFRLLPDGFFDRSPVLDVPAPEPGACHTEGSGASEGSGCGDGCGCGH